MTKEQRHKDEIKFRLDAEKKSAALGAQYAETGDWFQASQHYEDAGIHRYVISTLKRVNA